MFLGQVIADDTPVLQAVLMCDGERTELMQEEARLLAQLNRDEDAAADTSQGKELTDTEATARLEQVCVRLYLWFPIDATLWRICPGGEATE